MSYGSGPYGSYAYGWPLVGPFGVAIGLEPAQDVSSYPVPYRLNVSAGLYTMPPFDPARAAAQNAAYVAWQDAARSGANPSVVADLRSRYEALVPRPIVAATLPAGTIVRTMRQIMPLAGAAFPAAAFIESQEDVDFNPDTVQPGGFGTAAIVLVFVASGSMTGMKGLMRPSDLLPPAATPLFGGAVAVAPGAYYSTPEALARGREILRRRLHAQAAPVVAGYMGQEVPGAAFTADAESGQLYGAYSYYATPEARARGREILRRRLQQRAVPSGSVVAQEPDFNPYTAQPGANVQLQLEGELPGYYATPEARARGREILRRRLAARPARGWCSPYDPTCVLARPAAGSVVGLEPPVEPPDALDAAVDADQRGADAQLMRDAYACARNVGGPLLDRLNTFLDARIDARVARMMGRAQG